MGGYISKQLSSVIQDFTYNFEKEQFNLNLFQGSFRTENLFINSARVNDALRQRGLPFSLRFGLLKKFDVSVSYFSQRIESVVVDSLILILGESEENLYTNHAPQEEQDKYIQKLLTHLKSNYQKRSADFRKEFEGDPCMRREDKSSPKEPKKETPGTKLNSPEILSYELLDIIKNLLNCRITIGNVYVVYENNIDFMNSGTDLNLKQFNLTMYLKQLEFKSEQIEKYLDKN